MTSDTRSGRPEHGVEQTLAEIERLQSDRAFRDDVGLFFVEGIRNVVAAVEGGLQVQHLLWSDVLLTSSAGRQIVRSLRRAGMPNTRASPEAFRRVSKARRASGVALVLRQHHLPLHKVSPRRATCWVVLGRVRSTGNFGSLVRTSAAVGGGGFILVGGAVDPYDPVVVRATMGALFSQTFVRTGVRQLRDWIRRHRLQVVGVSPDGTEDYDRCRYRSPPLLVLGEERQGLDDEQRSLCKHLVRIPMCGNIDSLNLAVAGSLLMYETFRAAARRPSKRHPR